VSIHFTLLNKSLCSTAMLALSQHTVSCD